MRISKRKVTNEQKEFVKDNLNILSIKEIAKILNLSERTIRSIRQEIEGVKVSKLTHKEIEFILNSNLNSYELGKLMNRVPSTIRAVRRRNNINLDNKFIYSLQEFIYLFYMNDKNNNELINYYRKDRHTITNHINKIGLPSKKELKHEKILNKKEEHRKYMEEINEYYNNIRYNYFEIIDSKDKAYYLGLIASDGCIYKRDSGQKLLNIMLHKDDYYILDNFYNLLNIKRKTTISNNYSQLQIASENLFDDLGKYGIIPRKTWKLNLKNIPYEFISSFLLGYFDGDGSITKFNGYISSVYITYCGTKSSMLCLSSFLNKIGLNHSLIKDKRDKYNGEFYTITFKNTTEKYCFLKFIYDNNKEIMKLTRKEQRAMNFIKCVENNVTNRSENIKAMKEYAVLRQNLEKSQDD